MGRGPTQPVTFSNFHGWARPGPSIFLKSRPGPSHFQKSRPGPDRPVTIFRSARPGPARSRQMAHDKPWYIPGALPVKTPVYQVNIFLVHSRHTDSESETKRTPHPAHPAQQRTIQPYIDTSKSMPYADTTLSGRTKRRPGSGTGGTRCM